jgi:glycerol-3-phosphate dehydrogenase
VFDAGAAPLLSVYGGKITTYRKLAQDAVDRIGAHLGAPGQAWTGAACLPGGDIYGAMPSNRSVTGFGSFVRQLQWRYAWLPDGLARRYAHAYGSRIHRLLEGCTTVACLGRDFGHGLHERELRYLMRHEWARSADDVLWRRTKLGLKFDAAAATALDQWMQAAA